MLFLAYGYFHCTYLRCSTAFLYIACRCSPGSNFLGGCIFLSNLYSLQRYKVRNWVWEGVCCTNSQELSGFWLNLGWWWRLFLMNLKFTTASLKVGYVLWATFRHNFTLQCNGRESILFPINSHLDKLSVLLIGWHFNFHDSIQLF